MIIPPITSEAVTGSVSRSTCVTDLWKRVEWPRSPRTMWSEELHVLRRTNEPRVL